jgi:hypothetical protein
MYFSKQEIAMRSITRALCEIGEYGDHLYDYSINGSCHELDEHLPSLVIEVRGLLASLERYKAEHV